jgi:putative glutathione S-transferase
MGPEGWKFSEAKETPGCIPDPLYNFKYLKELYFKADPSYSARFTVPVLFDSKLETIVSNESADIIRMLNSEFNEFAKNPELDLYPVEKRADIDSVNNWVYDSFNNGVYRAGLATAQEKYEEAVRQVHEAVLKLEHILSKQRYLTGPTMTEADVRAFTTALRYDPVYYGHFKCNLISIKECPNLLRWMRDIYPVIKDTINMTHIKNHYYMSHKQINPTGIVPLYNGPKLD